MKTETVPGAARRARMRDNAGRLGKLQSTFDQWLNTRNGQLLLIVVAAAGLLIGATIGR